MSHTTENFKKASKRTQMQKKASKRTKMQKKMIRSAMTKNPKAGIHINKSKGGRRHHGESGSCEGDDIVPKYKRTNGCNKEKSSRNKNARVRKKSDLNQYDSDKDNSDEDDHSSSDGEYNDKNFSDEDGDENPRGENSSGEDSDDENPRGSSSDEDSDENLNGENSGGEDSDENSDENLNGENSGGEDSDENPRGNSSDNDSDENLGDENSSDEDSVQKPPSQADKEENPSTDESHRSKKHGGFKTKKEKTHKTRVVHDQDVDNINFNDGSSTSEEDDSDPSNNDSNTSKRPRGPTNPTPVLDSTCKKKIIFNGRGQPIGENSVLLSTKMGNIAKEMLPINCDDWRSKELTEHKKMCWHTILKKFIIDEEIGKPYVLKEIGKLWRARKSRLRIKIRACKSKKEIRALKPDGIQRSDWKLFVKNMSGRMFKVY